jgi:hypothetical protein
MDFAGAEVNFEEPGANTAVETGGRFHEPAPREPDFIPGLQFRELDNSFGNFLLASQGGFRAGQLTGFGLRAKSTHTLAVAPQ